MKRILLAVISLFACIHAMGQAQPQGAYHKFILKDAEAYRAEVMQPYWKNRGLVVFAKEDIPRLGTVDEVNALIQEQFENGGSYSGRIYLPKSLGEMNPKPVAIYYNLFTGGVCAKTVVLKGQSMPESTWSSWIIDVPVEFASVWEKAPDNEYQECSIECWASFTTDLTNIDKNEFGTDASMALEKKGKFRFLAKGQFTFLKGNPNGDNQGEYDSTQGRGDIGMYQPDENPEPETIPENWKEDFYKTNPVYKKPLKKTGCGSVSCADLEITEAGIKYSVEGSKTIIECTVINSGGTKTCETNAVFRTMWMEQGNEFAHLEQKIIALAPGAKTTLRFEIENFWFDAEQQVRHVLLDYDGNVEEGEEMNVFPVITE